MRIATFTTYFSRNRISSELTRCCSNEEIMKTLLLLIALIAAQVSRADTTNLVEILPFVVKSSQALEIEGFPQPLTTNNVSEFRVIRGGGLVLARVIVRDR